RCDRKVRGQLMDEWQGASEEVMPPSEPATNTADFALPKRTLRPALREIGVDSPHWPPFFVHTEVRGSNFFPHSSRASQRQFCSLLSNVSIVLRRCMRSSSSASFRLESSRQRLGGAVPGRNPKNNS